MFPVQGSPAPPQWYGPVKLNCAMVDNNVPPP